MAGFSFEVLKVTTSLLDAELGSAVHAVSHLARFVTLFEEKGTFYKKRGPKGDPFGPKGPLRGPGSPKGDPFGHTASKVCNKIWDIWGCRPQGSEGP